MPLFFVVADTPSVVASVRQTLAAHRLIEAPMIVRARGSRDADAVLIEWDIGRVGAFGARCDECRSDAAPVIPGVEPTAALAFGADVFHTLPVSPELVRAQVLAHRRTRAAAGEPTVVEAGPVRLDLSSGVLRVGSSETQLPHRQADVLACLLRSAGEVVPRERLLREAWGWGFDPGTNVVDVYIHYLRRVLSDAGLPGALSTVRGRGFRFTVPD